MTPRWLARAWPAILAVAATYVYFLLFAQFAFLHLLQAGSRSGRLDAGVVEAAMAAMGVAGLVTSLAMGTILRRVRVARCLDAGFALSAVAALATLLGDALGDGALVAVAALVGVGTAVLTVSLATGLAELADGLPLGPITGAGTGLAYFVCNLPPLFAGSTATQALAVVVACAVGLWAIRADRHPSLVAIEPADERFVGEAELRGLGFASVVAAFLVLVWLDSAAFAIIQENLELKSHTWAGPGRQLVLGAVHALAAGAAGALLGRGRFRSLLLGAFGLFVVAFTVLQHLGPWAVVTGPIYAVGISFYSTALVAFAAAGSAVPGRVPRRWRAAVVFGVGGWLGSALGVGMAQDLHRVPTLFLWITGAVLVVGAVVGRRLPPVALASPGPAMLVGVGAALLVYGGIGAPAARPTAPAGVSSAELGQQVYIREGCLHCHSQYVRPDVDERVHGPHAPIDREAGPVLIGNRRQGPDLSRVGERRDRDWLARHLADPRSVSPGSRMPAYPHLFEGSEDGDALVAYLASLRR